MPVFAFLMTLLVAQKLPDIQHFFAVLSSSMQSRVFQMIARKPCVYAVSRVK
jgi:hypothetical protein